MARKGIYRNNAVITGSNNPAKQVSKDAWNDDKDRNGMMGFAGGNVAISTGNLTVVDTFTIAESETTPSADDLANILTTETLTEDIIYLVGNTGDTITLKHQATGAGQIHTLSGADKILDTNIPTLLFRRGTDWYEFGGGGANSLTPWEEDIDADGYDLTDLSNLEFRTTTGAPAGTIGSIYLSPTTTIGLVINAPVSNALTLQVGGSDRLEFTTGSQWDFKGNDITNAGDITANNWISVGAGNDIKWGGSNNNRINNTGGLFHFESLSATGVKYEFSWFDDTVEYDWSDTQADWKGNNLVNVGYIESNATNPSATGQARFGNTEIIAFRNFANSADLTLTANISDQFEFNNSIYLNSGGLFFEAIANPAGTNNMLYKNGSSIIINNSGGNMLFRSAGTTFMTFSTTGIDVNGNLDDVSLINSDGATVASAGFLRLQNNTDEIQWRNNGNTADIGFYVDTNDNFLFNSNIDVAGFNIDNVQNIIYDMSTSGTDVDFAEDDLQEIDISANTTFTSANIAVGKNKTLKILCDGTLRTLSFPAGWIFVGTKPTDIGANKTGILSLVAYGATDADIVASYAVEA